MLIDSQKTFDSYNHCHKIPINILKLLFPYIYSIEKLEQNCKTSHTTGHSQTMLKDKISN